MPHILNFHHTALLGSAVYIGRAMPRHGLAASPWANPFRIDRDGTRAEASRSAASWRILALAPR
jgi:hypothetical protein